MGEDTGVKTSVARTADSDVGPFVEPIPELTSPYYTAHRQYGLFSAVLLAWELIGIELPESPIENVHITFKSPQAAPYVLIALVIYFGFRTTIEWFQSDPRRRATQAARIDFIVAHSIGFASVALFFLQQFLHLQVVSNWRFEWTLDVFIGIICALVIASYHEFATVVDPRTGERIVRPTGMNHIMKLLASVVFLIPFVGGRGILALMHGFYLHDALFILGFFLIVVGTKKFSDSSYRMRKSVPHR